MRGRLLSISLLAAAAALLPVACDRPPEPAAPASRPAATSRRIALAALPLTVEAPPTWDVRRGPGGVFVLSGRAPSGEREIALRDGPRVAAYDLPVTQPFTPDAPGSPRETRVDDRDGLRIVERLERLGSIDQPADVAPVRWTFRFIAPGGPLDRPSFELDVLDLTQITFERDEATVRAILDTVRPADAP